MTREERMYARNYNGGTETVQGERSTESWGGGVTLLRKLRCLSVWVITDHRNERDSLSLGTLRKTRGEARRGEAVCFVAQVKRRRFAAIACGVGRVTLLP